MKLNLLQKERKINEQCTEDVENDKDIKKKKPDLVEFLLYHLYWK